MKVVRKKIQSLLKRKANLRPSQYVKYRNLSQYFPIALVLMAIVATIVLRIKSVESMDLFIQSLLLYLIWAVTLNTLFKNNEFLQIALVLELFGNMLKSTQGELSIENNLVLYLLIFVVALVSKNFSFQFSWKILFPLNVMLFMTLLMYGEQINGTTAWLNLGGLIFQVTEIIKLVVIFMMGSVFSNKEYNHQKRLLINSAILLINTIGLILVKELATLFMIIVIFILGVLLFLEKKCMLYTLVGTVTLSAFLVMIALFVHVNYDVLAVSPLASVAGLFEKVTTRVLILFQPETLQDLNYQSFQAQLAVLAGGLIGTDAEIHIPAGSTDMALISCVVTFGFITSVLYLLLMLKKILIGIDICTKQKRKNLVNQTNAISLLLLVEVAVRTIYMALSNFGLLPIMGLPFPYISSGMTAAVTLWIANIFIVSGGEHANEKKKLFFKIPGIEMFVNNTNRNCNIFNGFKIGNNSRFKPQYRSKENSAS